MPENRNGLTLLRSEDWMAVWLGFVIIAAVLLGVRPPLPRFSWATDGEFAATVSENKPTVEKLIKEAEAKGRGGSCGLSNGAQSGNGRKRPEGDRRRLQKIWCRGQKERKTKDSKKRLWTLTGW